VPDAQPASTDPLVTHSVTKRFGDVVAVDGVDLRLEPGELLALVGPSGCGKSTLLRSIAGLYPIDEGSIYLNGSLVDDGSSYLPPERRATGLVFQEHALFPHLSVRDNVAYGVRDLDRAATESRVVDMLDLVELGVHRDRFPHELSGGERQRVALARALAPRPHLMLFDEPFASLDHNLRVQLRREVVTALRATQTAAILVTHDQREALAMGDRIAVMSEGRICQIGTAEEVFHQPINHFVAAFMGTASFLTITNDNGGATTALGPVECRERAAGDLLALVRPDDIDFELDETGPAHIAAREYQGTDWLITAQFDTGDVIRFTTSRLEPIDVGTRIRPSLRAGHHQVVIAR